jgi:hypothetical protein
MKTRVAGLIVLAFGIVGCVNDYTNPFRNAGGTAAPPAGADLIFLGSPGTETDLREIYALDIDGTAPPTRLTSCTLTVPACDIIDAAPAPDRQRVILRRRTDTNGDLIIQPGEPQQVVVIDLARSIEGEVLTDAQDVDSLQWTQNDAPLLYSAIGQGGLGDLFSAAQDGTAISNFTLSSTTRERHPRLVGQLLAFERAVPGSVSQIWAALTSVIQVTDGDPSLTALALPGTDYVVGSDADPEPSPDANQIVFRRLVGLGENGRGAWDIFTVPGNGDPPVALATGGFHGAPAWGPKGILFVEVPEGSPTASLVLITAEGTRRVLISDAPLNLQAPRWLP